MREGEREEFQEQFPWNSHFIFEELQMNPDLPVSQGINPSHLSRDQAELCLSAVRAARLLQQQADTCKTPFDRVTVTLEAAWELGQVLELSCTFPGTVSHCHIRAGTRNAP